MIKNTAGQKVGCQMVSATDGSAFTGSVTVSVTGDAGTQATGSVGAGACTHEGNGYHTYAPAQAETNYDLIAFTFTGTGAIPSTVQVYTVAGDAFTRLGAPAGASVSADIAAMKVDTAAILDDTGTSGVVVSASSVRTAVGLASANLDTQLDALPTAAENADAVWDEATSGHTTGGTFGEQVKTDIDDILVDTAVIGAAGAGLTAIPWNASWDAEVQSEVQDALDATLADSVPSDGTRPSVGQAVYAIYQFLTERSVSGTTLTVKKVDGSTTLMTFTLNDATTPTSITRAS